MLRSILTVLALALALPAAAHAQAPEAAPPKQQFAIVLKLVPRLLDDASWTDADNRAVQEHFDRLKALRDAGTVLLAGRTLNTDESQFGLVIVEVADEAEARAVMDGDPAVRGGVMTAQLFPYRVALLRTNP